MAVVVPVNRRFPAERAHKKAGACVNTGIRLGGMLNVGVSYRYRSTKTRRASIEIHAPGFLFPAI